MRDLKFRKGGGVMDQNQVKICYSCKHHVLVGNGMHYKFSDQCRRPIEIKTKIDLVTGIKPPTIRGIDSRCDDERSNIHACGPEGIYFQQKLIRISFLNRFILKIKKFWYILGSKL